MERIKESANRHKSNFITNNYESNSNLNSNNKFDNDKVLSPCRKIQGTENSDSIFNNYKFKKNIAHEDLLKIRKSELDNSKTSNFEKTFGKNSEISRFISKEKLNPGTPIHNAQIYIQTDFTNSVQNSNKNSISGNSTTKGKNNSLNLNNISINESRLNTDQSRSKFIPASQSINSVNSNYENKSKFENNKDAESFTFNRDNNIHSPTLKKDNSGQTISPQNLILNANKETSDSSKFKLTSSNSTGGVLNTFDEVMSLINKKIEIEEVHLISVNILQSSKKMVGLQENINDKYNLYCTVTKLDERDL
jgi:hypothetical protein